MRPAAESGDELALFAHARNWKRYVAAELAPYVAGRVLEVGAGTGNTTETLCTGAIESWLCLEPNAELASEIMAKIAAGQIPGHCRVRVGDLHGLDAADRFDTILYIDVLEHIESDGAELAAAAGRLAEGGFLIVLAPAWQWLYAPFDSAVGHYRRYDRRSLRGLTPRSLRVVAQYYLDSAGFVASLGNRLVLHSTMPTLQQIQVWDQLLVPVSRYLDRILARRFGKSVIAVWTKDGGNSPGTPDRPGGHE